MVSLQGWTRGGAALKHIPFKRSIMKTNNKLLLKNKYDYLELAIKISKLRYLGEELPVDLLLQVQKLGDLAKIPDIELNALLLNLETQ